MVSAEPASTGPRFDLLVIGDQVVIGRQVVAAGIAIRGERMAALLDLEQARQPGLAAPGDADDAVGVGFVQWLEASSGPRLRQLAFDQRKVAGGVGPKCSLRKRMHGSYEQRQ